MVLERRDGFLQACESHDMGLLFLRSVLSLELLPLWLMSNQPYMPSSDMAFFLDYSRALTLTQGHKCGCAI